MKEGIYMKSDLVYNKIAIIERCIIRVKEVYEDDSKNLHNFTKQDSIILNIQRACEASIDLAMHIVSQKNLGIPKSSREAFELLNNNDLIDASIYKSMGAMIGFRNIAVHDYQSLNIQILQVIIEEHLEDFKKYTKQIIKIV